MSEKPELSLILEAAIMASSRPLNIEQLAALFPEEDRPDGNEIREALVVVSEACEGRAFELKQVASGFRFQVRQQMAPWIGGLWDEKPQRYTRALLETLALIAYRQPITRGEIEDIRGVSVSSNIIRTLQEREWVRVVGHRDVPGRPAMFATTRQFLDYFNLQNLNELPPLSEIRDLEEIAKSLEIPPEIAEALAQAGGTLEQPELEDQEVIKERSAQELFDELDAMEAELPTGFNDLIKKQKVPALDLEENTTGSESGISDVAEPLSGDQLTVEQLSSEEPSNPSEEPDESLH
ncbi:SMC-Scp complex subunit ScpB [Endozoicomonas elysicola]|uniref:Segregation and condensation protein B n=1 Tax=Endozoicomonas elysicola TaxID=305900 RepID=A0A081KDK4_9GAMM|nr:SMC-Scp complex subunit ScpB [Endozoicomonas elysicola]KEI72230.1 segregation and condensation protein B [Endozoicomonas elysicola]